MNIYGRRALSRGMNKQAVPKRTTPNVGLCSKTEECNKVNIKKQTRAIERKRKREKGIERRKPGRCYTARLLFVCQSESDG